MALVPADFAAQPQINIHTPTGPAMNQLSTLDSQMKAILEDNSMAPPMKLRNYYYALKRYDAVQDNMDTQPSIYRKDKPTPQHQQPLPQTYPGPTVSELPATEHEILETLPVGLRNTGKLLLNYIKENPEISWTANRQMVYRGNPVPGSNIFDLVSDMTRNRRSAHSPQGWREFSEALIRQNVPRAAVGNERRWQFMTNFQRAPPPTTPPQSTPSRPDPNVAETPAYDNNNTTPTSTVSIRQKGKKKKQKKATRKRVVVEEDDDDYDVPSTSKSSSSSRGRRTIGRMKTRSARRRLQWDGF